MNDPHQYSKIVVSTSLGCPNKDLLNLLKHDQRVGSGKKKGRLYDETVSARSVGSDVTDHAAIDRQSRAKEGPTMTEGLHRPGT